MRSNALNENTDLVEKRHQGQYDDHDGKAASRSKFQWIMRAVGILVAFGVWFALGSAEGLNADARVVAAVIVLMAIWWMTEAIPLPATSLLPIVLLPLLTSTSAKQATAPYASTIVFLFLGGFLIAIAMEKWKLHRRIALLTLSKVGVSPSRIVLGMMLATGFLSMWVSNTATTLMMLPIGMSVLALVAERHPTGESADNVMSGEGPLSDRISDPEISRFGVCLLLAIAWAASMGGLGTLLGSPPNAILAGYVADNLGREVGFLQWMIIGLPLALSFILIGWLLMTKVLYRFKLEEIPGGAQLIRDQIADLGPMQQGEKMVLGVFVSAAFLWIVPGLLADMIPSLSFLDGLNDTVVAIGAGVILFILPGKGTGKMVLDWKDAEDGLPWGVLLLFGGGLSMAAAVGTTGLDQWFGTQVQGLGVLPPLLLIMAVTTMILFLTEVTSNTATAATFIPLLGGVAAGIGADPMGLIMPAAFAATCAFMLPVGTPPNAIVFGTGNVTISQMARGGFVLNIIGVLLITFFVYTLGGLALGITL